MRYRTQSLHETTRAESRIQYWSKYLAKHVSHFPKSTTAVVKVSYYFTSPPTVRNSLSHRWRVIEEPISSK